MNTINKVAIYVRVSTNVQAEEGYSIDEQIDKLKSYCQIKDITKLDYDKQSFIVKSLIDKIVVKKGLIKILWKI